MKRPGRGRTRPQAPRGAAPRGDRRRTAISAVAIALVLVAAGVAAMVGRSEPPAPAAATVEVGAPQLIYVWQPG